MLGKRNKTETEATVNLGRMLGAAINVMLDPPDECLRAGDPAEATLTIEFEYGGHRWKMGLAYEGLSEAGALRAFSAEFSR